MKGKSEKTFESGQQVWVFGRYGKGFEWVRAHFVERTKMGLYSVRLEDGKRRAFPAPYIRHTIHGEKSQ